MGLSGVMLNKDDIIRSAEANYGIVKYVADCLGCHRDTIYNWMHRDPEVTEAFTRARKKYELKTRELDYDLLYDFYEEVKVLIKDSHAAVVMFTLERKGKWTKAELDANQQNQTLVFQVNTKELEKVNDSNDNSIPVLSKAIPNKDTDSAA